MKSIDDTATCKFCVCNTGGFCFNSPPVGYYDTNDAKFKAGRPRIERNGVFDPSCSRYEPRHFQRKDL